MNFSVAKKPMVPRKARAMNDKLIRHCSGFGYIPYINLLNQILIYVQQAPLPVQTSLESPAMFASIINQLNNGGSDLITTNTINYDKKALKLLVLIFLLIVSKNFKPE